MNDAGTGSRFAAEIAEQVDRILTTGRSDSPGEEGAVHAGRPGALSFGSS